MSVIHAFPGMGMHESLDAEARAVLTSDGGHDAVTFENAVLVQEWLGPLLGDASELSSDALQRLLMLGLIVAAQAGPKLDLDLLSVQARIRENYGPRRYVVTAEYGPKPEETS